LNFQKEKKEFKIRAEKDWIFHLDEWCQKPTKGHVCDLFFYNEKFNVFSNFPKKCRFFFSMKLSVKKLFFRKFEKKKLVLRKKTRKIQEFFQENLILSFVGFCYSLYFIFPI
jgi:hypothetical protein